jgi:hypothetical protein
MPAATTVANMRIRLAIVFSLGVSTVALYGDEQIVHQRITANAAEAAYAYSCGYVAFINSTSSDLTLIRATNALVIGSFDEDFKASEDLVGGNRSFNHFYDPLDLTFGNGLSDAPPDIRVTIGRNSFTWGSTSNCVGLDFNGVAGIGRNVNTTNIWSWPNARGYELLGLTATNQADRIAALLNMYRAVGQVIHLLQDTSQPQHARNEQHVNPFTNWLAKLDPWASPIEDYGGKHHLELNYQQFMLDWKGLASQNWRIFGTGTCIKATPRH